MARGPLAALKRRLQAFPRLYAALHRSLYGALYLGERYLFGTRLQELLWRRRHVDRTMRLGPDHPHRAFLVEQLGRYAPLTSVFEVGCGTGANLASLRRAFPGLALSAVDINADAVAAATDTAAQAGPGPQDIRVGRAHDLSWIADRSVDVVLADAVLMYLGPDQIDRALKEMARIARRAVVLNEWHLFEPPADGARSQWYYAHWVHDYTARLATVPGLKPARVERLPAGQWGAGGWELYGALIVAER